MADQIAAVLAYQSKVNRELVEKLIDEGFSNWRISGMTGATKGQVAGIRHRLKLRRKKEG